MEGIRLKRMLLSAEEQLALNRLRLSKNSNVGERAHYVLLSGDGKSVKEIAIQLSRNEHTIRLWLNRYKAGGIPGLGRIKSQVVLLRKPLLLNHNLKNC